MRLTPDSRAPAKADPWKVCVGCNPCPCSGVVVVVVVVVVCCCCCLLFVVVVVVVVVVVCCCCCRGRRCLLLLLFVVVCCCLLLFVVVCCCCCVVVVAVVVRRMQTGNLLPEMRQHILQEFCVDGMDLLLGLGTSIEHRKISNLRLVVFYACRVW